MATNHHQRTSDFSKHKDQLLDTAVALGEDAQEIGQITKKLAGDTVDFISSSAAGYYKKGLQEANKIERVIENKIKAKPLKALLLAAGAGLVFGMLWRKK